MNPNDLPPVDPTRYASSSRLSRQKNIFLIVGGVLMVLFIGTVVYISTALGAVNPQSTEQMRFVISPGQTATDISRELHEQGLIRDPVVFQLYTQFTGTKSKLMAGGYMLSPAETVPQIVAHISSDKNDEVAVTILPGLTLEQLGDPAFEGSLAQQGFSSQEISSALNASYKSPLLAGKPPGSSLEGYLFPETYNMLANDPLEKIFQMSFDEFYSQIQRRNLEPKLAEKGLSLREGIILASIIQREVADPEEQKQVAQVFLKRLKEDIVLGSDPTFQYGARQAGRTPSINDPSPYNTRVVGGLPPGPIANFNISALEAVAFPAEGDFLFFVSGDDGITHFSRTEAEHIENTRKYCTTLCE